MKRHDHHLTTQISRLREAIKRKYKSFKLGVDESDTQLEQQYKPLLKELRKIPKSENISFKQEKEDENYDQFEFKPETYSSPNKTVTSAFLPKHSFLSEGDEDTFSKVSDVANLVSTDEGLESASQYVNDQFSHELTKEYMLKLMKDAGGKEKVIDHTYGPRFEGDVLMVGGKPLRFDDDGSIIIADTTYKPTHGLYDLLFKRLPNEEIYNTEDLKAYKDILIKTNAHKRNYKYRGNINRDQSVKYRHVISKLFPKLLYSGKGLFIAKDTAQPDLAYWNNPNEIVDRLRLLAVSTETGNTGHRNEIINILEELREEGIIKGKGNKKLFALLK